MAKKSGFKGWYQGRKYSSQKHPVLEYIFNKYNPRHEIIEVIPFTLKDISEGYAHCNRYEPTIKEPASISNTILDLTRKKNDISSRLPYSIYSLGYDIRKKTGVNANGDNLAGEFVHVGVGNEISSWFSFPDENNYDETIIIDSLNIPNITRTFIRRDEGAMFSAMDYCDIMTKLIGEKTYRIQHPLKFQPNEVDGFYGCQHSNGEITLFPIEAKALTTHDDINLEQMLGAIKMLHKKYSAYKVYLQPIGARMTNNGICFAFFERIKAKDEIDAMNCVKTIKVLFRPSLPSWK